ncbi:MAG: hypothetical protein U0271_36050 [Polyangiaceae bacterium]
MSEISFQCELAHFEDRLRLRYAIENGLDHAVAVLCGVSCGDVDGGTNITPNNLYAELQGDTLVLSKAALSVPPAMLTYMYTIPAGQVLAPGERLEESCAVAAPVRVRQPYVRGLLSGDVRASRPVQVRKLKVAIGVVPASPHVRFVADRPAYPELVSLVPATVALELQTLAEYSFELDRDLTVLDYVATPWPGRAG